MSPPHGCPEPAHLRQLLEEVLPPDVQADLTAHLQQCAPCRHRLEGLAAGREFWAEATHILRRQPHFGAAEPALERVLARLEGRPTPEASAIGDLGFLAPATRPGSLGRLGGYEILDVVGRGGMGVVLKAFDDVLHRVVAVKVMAPTLAANATARKRFIREAQAVAAVTHDHIVTIHAVHDSEVPYLVMQFVAGCALADKLNAGPLELAEVLRIGLQTASGLAAAHAQGVVHRDIKPANILLENHIQRVKITDFGLAQLAGDAGLTEQGVVAGTPPYMSPEQARGDAVDHRSDLFSLGSVLYAMCTGIAPFRGSTNLAIARRVCDEAPVAVRALNPAVPEELAAVIERLHAKDPRDRYPSAADVAAVLSGQLARLQGSPAAAAPARRPSGTLRQTYVMAGLALVALAVGVTAFIPGRKDGQAPKASPAAIHFQPSPVVCAGHTEPVLDVVYSPDGTTVASTGTDRTIRLWDPQTGQVRHVLEGHTKPVHGLAFSPDGTLLASAADGGEVWLWDVAAGRARHALHGASGDVFTVAFSPDGKTVAAGGWDPVIHLWDVDTARERSWPAGERVIFTRRLAFAPDGGSLVGAGYQVSFWNPADGTKQRSFGLTSTSAVAYAPDGRTLAAACWKAGAIALYDPADGRQRAAWQAHRNNIEALGYSPDGRLLASVGDDNVVRLWDVAGPRLRAEWRGHEGRTYAAVFSPDGTRLATGCGNDKLVKIWDITHLPEAPPDAPEPLVATPLLRSLAGHTNAVLAAAFHPDGQTLATGGHDGTVRLWDVATGAAGHVIRAGDSIYGLAFAPDGKLLASAGGQDDHGTANLWDVASGGRVAELPGPQRRVFDIAFSPDGSRVAIAGNDSQLRILDVARRAKLVALANRQPTFSRRLAFTGDGRTLLACGTKVSYYNAEDGTWQFDIPHEEMSDMKLSPRGDVIAAAGWKTGKIALFDVVTHAARATWQAHHHDLQSLAFSPDGRFLVSASADGSAKIWEVATQRLRAVLLGHFNELYAVAFSPDGRTVATTGQQDALVLLWDVSALHAGRTP